MTLSAFASVLLLPPVNLVGLAILGWMLRRHRAGRVIVRLCLAALLLLAIPCVATPLLASLEWGLPMPDASQIAGAQAIVVLGAEVSVGIGAAGAPAAQPGPLTLQRLQWAAALARRTHLPVLVSGGVVDRQAPAVAVVMARSLQDDFGVPVRWVEPGSHDTWENATYSTAMLRRDGISKVLVLTHAWHMRRALIAFRAAGLTAIPVVGQWDRFGPFEPSSLVPHAANWMRSYYAFHEWIGCLWYWLRAQHHGRAA